MVIASEYAINKFNASSGLAGLSASIFVIGAMFTRLLVGKWIGRLGYKKTLTIGLVFMTVMAFFYFAISSLAFMLVVRFLHGAFFGISMISTTTIVADIVPPERRGEGMGYFILSNTIATAIGPFLAMFLGRYGSYSLMFIICSGTMVLSVLTLPLLSLRDIVLTEEQKRDLCGFKLRNCIEPGVVPISIVSLLFFLCYTSIISFISVYSKQINLSEVATYFFVIFAAVNLVSRPYAGRRFDKKGENSIMYIAIPIFTIGLFVFSRMNSALTLILSAVLIGIGFGSMVACTQAIIVKITPRHRLGMANSTFFVLSDLGVGGGPLIVGLLIPYAGYRGIFLIAAGISIVCLAMYYWLHGRKAAREELLAIKIK